MGRVVELACEPCGCVQTSVPQLVQLACHEACPPDVQLSALQTLTNLSHDEATSHAPYTPLVQRLYEALDAPETGAGAPALRRQALALLANLSVDAVMVPHLLAAKVTAHNASRFQLGFFFASVFPPRALLGTPDGLSRRWLIERPASKHAEMF